MNDTPRAERIAFRQGETLLALLRDAGDWIQGGHPLDASLARYYHTHPEFGSRDRRLFSGTLYSYFRWKGWIDAATPRLEERCILAYLAEAPLRHAAIDALAQRAGFPADRVVPMGTQAAGAKALFPSADYPLTRLVPEWVVPHLGLPPRPEALLHAFQKAPPTWLRCRHASQRETLVAALHAAGMSAEQHPVLEAALALPRGINLRSLPQDLRNLLVVQDLASQAIALACAPTSGESWWDACAGSGGKSLHLADLAPGLRILATDIRPGILEELAHRNRNPDPRTAIRTAVWDGLRDEPPGEFFDGVLIDAPCSGSGTWHRNPDARWRLGPERLEQLLAAQAQLLARAATRVAPAGQLLYATCSVFEAENEAQITRFLASHPDFRLSPFSDPLTRLPCNGMLAILPGASGGNGMFMAKLARRTGNMENG